MGESLVAMGPAVANHLWQSTAFAAVAWAVAWLLRKNQARVRYAVWLAASVKFLAPFALLISLGGMLPRPKQAVVAMPVYSAVDEVGMPFDEVQGTGIGEQRAEESSQLSVLSSQIQRGMPEVLVGVWLGGVVTVLAVWWVRWRQVAGTLRRAEAGARQVDPTLATMKPSRRWGTREAELLREVERKMGARVRLVLSGELMEPGVFGVVRPVLIWPERLSQRLDDEHVEAILAHELMHVRRRDNLTAALHMLVEAAFWFHPAVWWVGARLVEERERACDEAVVEMGSRPGVYAEGLLKAVRFCVESPLKCVAGVTGADLKQRVRWIMTLRVGRLGWGKKLLIAAAVVSAIAGPVAFGVVRMIPMFGQIPDAAGPLPSFEVATIKPSDPERRGMGFTMTGRHFSTLNTTASDLLQYAYGVQARQIVDAPAWMDVDKYDIAAVASEGDADPKWKLMVRKLLADRFGLSFHHDTRELPVYELRIGKNGPKLAKSGADVDQSELYFSRTSKSSAGTTLHAKAATMAGLASLLQVGQLERPVVDRTGLTGTFDFTMDFTADTAKGGDAAPGSEDMNAPAGIFTAIQEQLGLKLVAGKGPAEVMVIDRIEKPAPDSAASTAVKALEVAAKEVRQMLEPQGVSPPDSFRARLLPVGQEKAADGMANPTRDGEAVTNGAPGAPLRFDVVSVRPSAPQDSAANAGRRRRMPVLFTDDGLSIQNASLHFLLMHAYEVSLLQGRILNAPGWVDTQNWSIEAKVDASDVPAYSQIAHDKTPEGDHRRALMLQALLVEQFKLRAHMETREGSVYLLEVAKGGVKAKQTSTGDTGNAPDASGRVPLRGVTKFVAGPGHLDLPDSTVGALGIFFTSQLGAPVIDKTGLTGRYDLKLDWQPDTGASATPDASDPVKPSLFTAMEEQLGLKLVPGKGPLPVVTIDHIEKPEAMDGAEAPAATGAYGHYQVWLDQDVRWIVNPEERAAFLRLTNDQERDKFIEQFWQRRNPNPDAAGNAYKAEIYARIAYANEHFAESQPGWSTDRGHVYIVYGKPDEVDVPVGDWTETWRYRHMAGVGDNIVLKFGFVATGARRHVLVPPLPAGLFGRGTDPTPAPTRDGKTVTNGAPAADQTPNPLKRRLADVERARGEAFGGARTVLQGAAGVSRVQDGGPMPAFDVASIHLAAPSPDGHHHIWNDVHQSQFRTGNLSVRDLIQYAYGLPKSQILGGPDWLDSAMFDIDAKTDPSVDAELHGLSSDDAAQQKRRMVQALLADRFALTAHKETRQLPGFALVLAKGGPKFKPAQVNGTTIDTYPSRLHISGSDDTVAVLARELAQSLGRVVLNQTGLIGRYDLTLSWTPDDRPAPTVNGAPDPNAPPGLFTAIQEQLGLKLESTKAPVDVLVIDRVERPSEN